MASDCACLLSGSQRRSNDYSNAPDKCFEQYVQLFATAQINQCSPQLNVSGQWVAMVFRTERGAKTGWLMYRIL